MRRVYDVSIPPRYDGRKPAPLVVVLHPLGGDAAEIDRDTDLPNEGGRRGYVVVAPDGLLLPPSAGPGYAGLRWWNIFGAAAPQYGTGVPQPARDPSSADDITFLGAVLDETWNDLCVDPSRVYATGGSNGAGMTTQLGCTLADRLAAIAPVAGVNLTGVCPGSTPIAVLAIHGTADEQVAYTGNDLEGHHFNNPSVPARMAQWARRNRCAAATVVDRPFPQVVRTTWQHCARGADTVLWTAIGGPHAWPSTVGLKGRYFTFDATRVILDFFDRHSLRLRS